MSVTVPLLPLNSCCSPVYLVYTLVVRWNFRLLVYPLPLNGWKVEVTRPRGPAVHGNAPNDLLQFDYMEIASAAANEKYILMLRGDHSTNSWLFACSDTVAENTACAIISWSAAFIHTKSLMSGDAAHFKSDLLRFFGKDIPVPHHFTLP